MVSWTLKDVGDRAATIGKGPGSVLMPIVTTIAIIAVIGQISRIAKKTNEGP
jgi:hypothetical protein